MIFNEAEWTKRISGFRVSDCSFGFDNNKISFLLLEDDSEWGELDHEDRDYISKILVCNLEKSIESRFVSFRTEYLGPFATMVSSFKLKECVAVDLSRHVIAYKPANPKEVVEADLPIAIENYNLGLGVHKLCRVEGEVFAVCSPWHIVRRVGYNKWRALDLPIPKELLGVPSAEFSQHFSEKQADIIRTIDLFSSLYELSGFSLNDMYTVGDRGIIWHFNGVEWQLLAFPTNKDLFTVCCADDGQVYISTRDGDVWVGRESTWKLLLKGALSLPYRDSAWFAGRLWCANDYGMWVLEDKKMVECAYAKQNPVPFDCASKAGRIDISPDKTKMLIGGMGGAAMYDGKKWEVLFSTYGYDM